VMPELAALLADDAAVAAAYAGARPPTSPTAPCTARCEDRRHLGGRHADTREVPARPRRARSPAGAGVNPIGDLALARADWSPERCTCADPGAECRRVCGGCRDDASAASPQRSSSARSPQG
jgi:hypothetical protein